MIINDAERCYLVELVKVYEGLLAANMWTEKIRGVY